LNEETPEKEGSEEEYIEASETGEAGEEYASEELEERVTPSVIDIEQLKEMIEVSNLLEAAISSSNPQTIIEQLTEIRRAYSQVVEKAKSRKQRRRRK